MVQKPGYVYIYVANESMAGVDVYFDDLTIKLTEGPATQLTDYYPFGLKMEARSYAREHYRFGYQGQFAEMDEETGWNAFEARMYDAKIGRWMATDPAGQFYSSYLGMGNNPLNQIDPDGAYSKIGALWRSGFGLRGGIYQSGFDNNGKEVWGFNSGGVSYFGTYGEGVDRLSEWKPDIFQKWGMSDNIIASTTYKMADGPWVTAQFFTPWRSDHSPKNWTVV